MKVFWPKQIIHFLGISRVIKIIVHSFHCIYFQGLILLSIITGKTSVMYAKPKMFFGFLLVLSMFLFSFSCNKEETIVIVPADGYDWPAQDRAYWPTDGWQTATLEDYAIDPIKMEKANQFAKNDPLARALLVVKDGYIVYENYYGDGAVDASTNLWSVTKSFSSALVGILMDRNIIGSSDQLMAELMPAYPEFNAISLQHVLTMTTGLSWNEEGPLWVQWIFSDDWVAAALARGQVRAPGEQFYYSSGNSHFLMALVDHKTGEAPGKLAKEQLFDPMGIPFEVLDPPIIYDRWEEYMLPLEQSWRKDPNGIECASFGLYLTARDMAKFGYLYLNKGQWEGRQLLS
ncbi:MAG: serine hydrolase, partial [Maribacter sp.]|nr:serine hydrolase [Maribacter sp.]